METTITALFGSSNMILAGVFLYVLAVILLFLNLLKKSDRRAIHILESIDESFMAFDNKWRFTYLNQRACEFIGKSKEELFGKDVLKLYPEFKESYTFKKYLQAKESRKPVRFQYTSIYSKKNFMISAFPSPDGLSVYVSDITRIKKAERKMHASELRFRDMADHAPVLIWMSDSHGNLHYFNKQWLNFTGKTMEEEVNDGWLDGIHPEDKQFFLDTYMNSIEARIEFQIEYRLKRFDGEYRWVFDQGTPMYEKNGNFLGYIGSCIDISDRKEIEQRKDEFISIASHELKTPVTSIKAFTQLLMSKMHSTNIHKKKFSENRLTDDVAYEYLKRMDNQINNLTGLISDLLDVSKIEQGKLTFNKDMIELSDLITSVVEDIQETHKKHKIIIRQNDKVKVLGDQERIRQVLINLIDNAIKYSPGKNKVILNSVSNSHSVTVSVQDFGVGIPKEKHNKVFDRFYRVGGDKSETFAGLGLGLYITSEIMKRHGGRIWVKSKTGSGSTFSFSLPLSN